MLTFGPPTYALRDRPQILQCPLIDAPGKSSDHKDSKVTCTLSRNIEAGREVGIDLHKSESTLAIRNQPSESESTLASRERPSYLETTRGPLLNRLDSEVPWPNCETPPTSNLLKIDTPENDKSEDTRYSVFSY